MTAQQTPPDERVTCPACGKKVRACYDTWHSTKGRRVTARHRRRCAHTGILFPCEGRRLVCAEDSGRGP